MAEVIKVSTIERHLYAPDAIPWIQLRLSSNLQKLQDRYKFGEIRQGADPSGNLLQVICVGGEFAINEVPRAVEQFILEPNAIQVQIGVSSSDSQAFLENVAEFLTEIDPDKSFARAQERARTYQTIVTARLTVPFDALLAGPLHNFLRDIVSPRLKLPDADVQIALERLGWRVTYRTQSTDFLYLPKVLTIEPRAGSNPSEMLYYTQSPTDFNTHKSLLEAFEKSFAGVGPRQEPEAGPKA